MNSSSAGKKLPVKTGTDGMTVQFAFIISGQEMSGIYHRMDLYSEKNMDLFSIVGNTTIART